MHRNWKSALGALRSVAAFTLIEMLVVIAIIALLAALLIPAVGKAIESGRRATAVNEIKQIEAAWRSYFQEYAKYPSGITEMNVAGVNVLRGGTNDLNNNPRKLPFLDVPSKDVGGMRDPWGRIDNVANAGYYQLAFDDDYDNMIILITGGMTDTVYRAVAVWSKGRLNGLKEKADDPKDDIRNWRF